ncbi:hypothetical protein JYK14_00585 [Siccirubricoccus sp. KC 17139]|uniref:Uncharacterized protein n=1 Tax=Siccirubricoccus soli TaxID=2899147 RepID=A0ABT1CYF0_9PROT|nr:hypothetical protein [Siccirubricoccus soli]MCO6414676.1 hypothetical protein [Siccirubricoccus soli]MCP2680806.1 hypothetical protein [Siccirubricoccus soli]
MTLPFTSPNLLGGRIRLGERGQSDLILANPAGVEGAYVLPWSALPDFCTPTLHDRAIWERVAKLPKVTPRTVREVTRTVAREGYAGRNAARAAQEAERAGQRSRVMRFYALLAALVAQAGLAPAPAQESAQSLEQRAREVLRLRGREAGLGLDAALLALQQLAEAFEFYGPGGGALLPGLVARIEELTREVAAWAAGLGEAERAFAALLRASAELSLTAWQEIAAPLEALLADVWGLIRRWQADPAPILNQLARPEWLLDGWELLLALWANAPPARRGEAAREMAAIIPVTPAEVETALAEKARVRTEAQADLLRFWRRKVHAHEDWVTGQQVALVARNEALRATAIGYLR